MTRILIIFLSIMGLISSVKADTIDYWHVYYNKAKIKEYNQYSKGEITLKIKNIKKSDSLIVNYFSDTPCVGCKTQVSIEIGKHLVTTKGNPIKISVFDLLQYHLQAEKEIYEAFYFEESIKNRGHKILIFRIKFE